MRIRMKLENSISEIIQEIPNATQEGKLDKLLYYGSKLTIFEDMLLMRVIPEIENLQERITALEILTMQKSSAMIEAYLTGQLDAYKTILDLEKN